MMNENENDVEDKGVQSQQEGQQEDVEENKEGLEAQSLEQEDEEEIQDLSGNERVDISDPKVQKRVNSLYKQVKMSDARNQALNGMLEKAMTRLDEFEKRFAQTDSAQAERILKVRLKNAQNEGDETLADQIQDELIEFKISQKMPKQVQQKQQDLNTDPDFKYLENIASERDEIGNFLRPWLKDNHPQNAIATREATLLTKKHMEKFGQVDIPQLMEELDDVMKNKTFQTKKTQWNPKAQDPMGSSNLTRGKIQSKIKLSSQEMAIAKKLGITEEQYREYK